MHTEHDAPNTNVNPEAIKEGHEPDRIDLRTILYVPVALIITFALAFGTVTLIINYLRANWKADDASSLAASRNRAVRDQAVLNERLNRISSTNPNADVKAPRLEGLDQLSSKEAPYFESSVPTKEGNSTHYHPEDLRPSSAWGKQLGLQDYGWKDKEKNLVRIPIAEAMRILGKGAMEKADGDEKKLFQKVLKYEDKVNPDEIRPSQPKPSNPFWGVKQPTPARETPKGGGH